VLLLGILSVPRTNLKGSKKKTKRRPLRLLNLLQAASSSKVRSLSSQVLRAYYQSRMKRMPKQTRIFLSIRTNSKNRSRFTMPNQLPARRVNMALPVRRPKNLLILVRNVREENVNLEPLKLLRRPKKIVMTASSMLKVTRDAVVKAEEADAEAEVVVATTSQMRSTNAKDLARKKLSNLLNLLQSLLPRRRKSP
jgi:hypothetical protein